jgi:hypothetical protein
MVRNYLQLFDLTVKHTYYNSGYSNDFVFSPTMKTAKDLSRYKLIARPKNGVVGRNESYGLKVSYTDVDNAPLIPITATDRPSMVFGMNLVNTNFLHFTNEIPAFANQECWYITNVGVSVSADINLVQTVSLNRTPIKLRSKVFELNFSVSGLNLNSATIKILNESGVEQVAYNQSLTTVGGKYDALINLNGLDDGIYSVEIRDGGSLLVSDHRYYISDELTAMKPMAILDLRLNDNTQLRAKKLEINFTPKAVYWKYWVVYRKIVANVPSVTKSGLTFNPTVPSSPMDLETYNSLLAQYPTASSVRLFVSSTEITLDEDPIKEIKLNNTPSTPPLTPLTILVKNMPGMPIDSAKTEAYIFI